MWQHTVTCWRTAVIRLCLGGFLSSSRINFLYFNHQWCRCCGGLAYTETASILFMYSPISFLIVIVASDPVINISFSHKATDPVQNLLYFDASPSLYQSIPINTSLWVFPEGFKINHPSNLCPTPQTGGPVPFPSSSP